MQAAFRRRAIRASRLRRNRRRGRAPGGYWSPGCVRWTPAAALLGRTEDNADDSIKRIRKAVLKDFDPEAEEYRALYKEFGLSHFADVFKTYAYFGFYPPAEPPGANRLDRFSSPLSEQLAKLR